MFRLPGRVGLLLALVAALAPAVQTFAAATHSEEEAVAACLCDRKSGRLVIRYLPYTGDHPPAWTKSKSAVWFMSLLDLDAEGTIVLDSETRSFTCRLRSDRFQVTLEPSVPNINLLGRCGAAVTGAATVKRNGTIVVEKKEFENRECFEREKYLEAITFRDGSAEPEFSYRSYDE